MQSKNLWFIVAGGPSLKGFDFNLLKGKNIIAVNKSFQVLPFAQIVYFTDLRFWQWHKDELLQHKGRIITGHNKIKHDRVENYQITGKRGLELKNGCLKSGNNSGYAAINLAVHQRAVEIILLGFDMCFDNGKSHWHEPHIIPNKEEILTEKMLPYFDSLVGALAMLNINVINANLKSAINSFEKKRLQDVVSEYCLPGSQKN